MNEPRLDGRVCVITGAAGGLGAALVKRFKDAGAHIVKVTRSNQADEETFSRQRLINVAADLSELNASEHIANAVRTAFGSVHVVINAAAIQGPVGPFATNDCDAWEATLRVNLFAPVAICRALLPLMKEGGKIINLSGGGAATARPNFSAYATAKAALVRFSETLAEELRSRQIDVNTVAPGVMNTKMLQTIRAAGAQKAGSRELEIAGRASDDSCDRAAELCLFLASAASNGITGKLISAAWDPWRDLPQHLDDLTKTDIYTLRRIVPKDRSLEWGVD